MPIPFPRTVAAINRRITNPILGPIVWFLPGFGVIEHVGRRTGNRFRAPMLAFRSRDGRRLTFALTYGAEANWVQNALAAGFVDFSSRSAGRLHLVDPRLIHDPARRAMPWLVRRALGVVRVDDFLETTVESGGGAPSAGDGQAADASDH